MSLYFRLQNFSSARSSTATPDSPWLAGLHLDSFPGHTLGQRIAQAAHSINVDILSPAAKHDSSSIDPDIDGWIPFTTRDMVDKGHELGLQVKPWTVSCLLSEFLPSSIDGMGWDGIR